jgi:arsenate reductase
MDRRPYNVLFICTGNSARSVLAEGLLNSLGKGRFNAYSAGSHPKGLVHPLALRELREMRIPTDGLRSKSWAEFAAPDAPRMDFVFTVCDQAAGEVCPIWPGQPVTAHWGMPDPAAVQGTDEVRQQAFRDAAVALKRRLELLMALPLQSLDAMALHRQVKEIGKR